MRRQPLDRPVADQDRAGRGCDEAADQVERRRLAAAGRAEQAEELALGDLEVDLRQRLLRAVALADSAERDCRGGQRSSSQPQERRRINVTGTRTSLRGASSSSIAPTSSVAAARPTSAGS